MSKFKKIFGYIKKIRINNSIILVTALALMISLTAYFLATFSKKNSQLINSVDYNPIALVEEINLERELDLTGYNPYEINKDYFYSSLEFYQGVAEFAESAYETITLTSAPVVEIGDMLQQRTLISETQRVSGQCLVLDISHEENTILLQYLDELYVEILIDYTKLRTYSLGDDFLVFHNKQQLTTAKMVYIDYLNANNQKVPVKLKLKNNPLMFINGVAIDLIKGVKDSQESFFIEANFLSRTTDFDVINKNIKVRVLIGNKIYSCNMFVKRTFYNMAEIISIDIVELSPDVAGSKLLAEGKIIYFNSNASD